MLYGTSYYKLDGNANDSIDSNNGTVGANVTWVTGKINQCASFNATATSYIEHGTTATYSFIQNTGIFTIDLLYKLSVAGTTYIVCGNTATTTEKGYFLRLNNGGAGNVDIQILKGVAGTPVIGSTASGLTSDTNWHHLVVTGDGTNIFFYQDDVLFAGSGTMGTFSSGNSTRTHRIGQANFSSSVNPLNGQIDEFGIWPYTFNKSQVNHSYNGGSGISYPFGSGNIIALME